MIITVDDLFGSDALCPICRSNPIDHCGLVETNTGFGDMASEYGCYYRPNITYVF